MFSLLAFICIGSTFCQVISGLTLISNVYGFTNGFSLTCKVQGTITTQLTLTDPAGNVAAGCFQPPSGCGSSAGNTFDRNIPEGTFTVNIIPANVNVANHKGVWTCSDGVNIAQYEIKEIVSYTEPIIQSEVEAPITGSVITVLIGCIYPYPDEVKISYVKESSQDTVLKSRSDVKFDNGSSVNCKSSDARAISMNGSFLVSTDNLNGEEARIAVTVLLNGNVLGKIGYSNFTIKSEKGCKYSDVELIFGGVSCFLIVLITSIIMLIIQGCKILLEIFGDIKPNKVIIIIVFDLVALIIGLALGFSLKECDQRDIGLGLGLGFGFILAIALVVTLYIYHKKCGSKKENEDENRFSLDSCFRKCQVKPEKEIKPEDNPQRVGSPASASNIKMESKNKTDVLKGDQSALKQKVLHSPLPLPPVDNSQPPKASDDKLSRKKLDPIAVENEVANSSEKKKKKKKKKKKRAVGEAGDNENEN